MPKSSTSPANEFAQIKKRAEEHEIRAREFEAQARVIEARLRLARAQTEWREYLNSGKGDKLQ